MSPWLHLLAGLFIWWATLRLCGFWRAIDRECWLIDFDCHIRPHIERSNLAADLASYSNPSPEEMHEILVSALIGERAALVRRHPASVSWTAMEEGET